METSQPAPTDAPCVHHLHTRTMGSEEIQPPSSYKAELYRETTAPGPRADSHFDRNKLWEHLSRLLPTAVSEDGRAGSICHYCSQSLVLYRERPSPRAALRERPHSTSGPAAPSSSCKTAPDTNPLGCGQVSPLQEGPLLLPALRSGQIRAGTPRPAAHSSPSPIQREIFSVRVSSEQEPSPKAAPGDTVQAPAAPSLRRGVRPAARKSVATHM